MRYEHTQYGRRVILQITRNCPLRCSHCIAVSGPEEKQQLEDGEAMSVVQSLADDANPHELVITGGEPFVRLKLLRKLVAFCHSHSISVDIVSSATWASSVDRANKTLDKLPGLTQLSLSADRHHEEFLPLDNVKFAALAATERGIRTGLFITLDDETDNYPDRVREAFGENLWKQLDVMQQIMHYSGRAVTLHGRLNRIKRVADLPTASCPLPAAPAVLADGRVMACCGDTVSDPDAWPNLTYGHVSDDIVNLIEQNNHNPIVQLLRIGGPKLLLTVAEEADYDCQQILSQGVDTRNTCELCQHVTGDNALLNTVNQHMQQADKLETLSAQRLLTLGEWVTS